MWLRRYGISLLLILLFTVILWGITAAEPPIQEVTVIGKTAVGLDPDQAYKNAIIDAFRTAVQRIQTLGANETAASEEEGPTKDLVLIQKELGIIDYQVLRYWREEMLFLVELKVTFGETKGQQPQLSNHGRLPKLKWVSQADDQVLAVAVSKEILLVNTTRAILLLNPTNGKKISTIDTGLMPHAISGEHYIIQDRETLKVYHSTGFNLFNLMYTWHKKLPELNRFYSENDTLFTVDRSGLVRAFDWSKGALKWQLAATSQVEVAALAQDKVVLVFPTTEIWVLNEKGEKVWLKRFDTHLLVNPLAKNGEVICLLNNGQLKVFDLVSGRLVSAWSVKLPEKLKNVSLSINENQLLLSYNDTDKGQLESYDRYTGSMRWRITWDEAITGLPVSLDNYLVIGIGKTFEARDFQFGLKIWAEPAYGRITKLFKVNEQIIVGAENRLYRYDLP